MKRSLLTCALLLAFAAPSFAYTAYPWISASATNSGLTGGSLIGYTVLGANGTTVITARTTTGIVEIGGGTYVIASGLTVPDGSAYVIKWDRSDTSLVMGAAYTVPSDYLGTIKTATAQLQFDGSGYVKSDNQTNVTLATGQNVATVGSQAPPTNWSATAITAGGIVTANATQISGHTAAVDANNLLQVDIEDVHGGAISSTTLPVNTTQFNGHAVALDSGFYPKTDDSFWNGTAITTGVPNTAAATVGGYASGQDPATLIGAKVVDGTVTYNNVMAALLSNLWGTVGNSFNSSTHVLTTTYKRQDGTTTAFTNSTQYNSVVTPPVQSRTGAVGTLP